MPDYTVTLELSNDITAEISAADSIVVEVPAAQGPKGDKGDPGVNGGFFEFTQGTPSDTWVIAHNLDCFPNVTVVDSSGREVEGDVQYIDLNNIQILFSAAFAGQAYLS